MDALKEFIDFVCFTGLNNHFSALLANNALWLGPIGMAVFAYLKHRAKLTPETWDDEMIKAIGERIGLEPVEDEEEVEPEPESDEIELK